MKNLLLKTVLLLSCTSAFVSTSAFAQTQMASLELADIKPTYDNPEMAKGVIFGTDNRIEIEQPYFAGKLSAMKGNVCGITLVNVWKEDWTRGMYAVTAAHCLVKNEFKEYSSQNKPVYTRTKFVTAKAEFYQNGNDITLTLDESDLVYMNYAVGQKQDYGYDIAIFDVTSVSNGLMAIEWGTPEFYEPIHLVAHTIKYKYSAGGTRYSESTFTATSCFGYDMPEKSVTQAKHTVLNTDCDLSQGTSGGSAIVLRNNQPVFIGPASHFFVQEKNYAEFRPGNDGAVVASVMYTELN